MEIKEVLSNKELEKRFKKLCKSNWKIENMADGLDTVGAKETIDKWFAASRPMLLKMLKIEENKDYKFVYHELKT